MRRLHAPALDRVARRPAQLLADGYARAVHSEQLRPAVAEIEPGRSSARITTPTSSSEW
jgi:hypothetical protein